jgi:TctA family transporter
VMDGNLAATAGEATTRVLILEVAVILTALMAALAAVIAAKVKRLKYKQVITFLVKSLVKSFFLYYF